MKYLFAFALLLFATSVRSEEIPAEYDHPFDGLLIVTVLPVQELRHECNDVHHSWDARERPDDVQACSYHYANPLRPGVEVCRVWYRPLDYRSWWIDQAVWAIRTETANCNGWHDKERAWAATR